MKIVLIGSGNVATHLGKALRKASYDIAQVYSRTTKNAHALAKSLKTAYTTNLSRITKDADLYLFAVKDDVLPDILQKMPHTKGIYAHTAGSLDLSVFSGIKYRCGVFYPLQTFSKEQPLNFYEVPILLEASDHDTFTVLVKVAQYISSYWEQTTSRQRMQIHAAAVFACNFTNHLYALSEEILDQAQMPFYLLHPLIRTTTHKALNNRPYSVQTGPAVRDDKKVIQKHTELLSFAPKIREVYQLLTDSISRMYNKNKDL